MDCYNFSKGSFYFNLFQDFNNFFVKCILPKIQMLYSPNIQRSLSSSTRETSPLICYLHLGE